MADENRPEGVSLNGVPLLDRTFKFLVDQFANQPPWLRAFVYFIFVMFFVVTATRLIGGQYAIKGVIWDGDNYASNCEVRLNGEFFSTNARGEYYALFTSAQYYSLLVSRSINLPVVRAGHRDHSYPVTLKVFDGEFNDISLGSGFVTANSSRESWKLDLVPAAYAQTKLTSRSADRLFIDRLSLSNEAKNVRAVELQMGIKGQINPRLRSLGEEAGKLPVKGASSVNLPRDSYYFDMARSLRGQKVTIELNGASGFFQNFHETFIITVPTQPLPINVPGNRGGSLMGHFVPAG